MIILHNRLHFLSVDDNRVSLQPIAPYTEYQRNYINASYIDVRVYATITVQHNACYIGIQ